MSTFIDFKEIQLLMLIITWYAKSLIYKKYTRRLQKKFQKYLKIKFICYQSMRLFKRWKSFEHDRFRWLKN